MRQTWDRLGYFRKVADRLEEEPALIGRALETADRWLDKGVQPRARIVAWRDLLARSRDDLQARAELLQALREDSEDAEFHREFAPVPGILSKAERREFSRECAYSH
jgi:hypothetical protein